MSTNRQYELVYIVTPEASDEQVTELHTQIEQIIQRYNGTLDKPETGGRRKLAYEIGHHREGNYVVETITGSGELMKEIDRRLRVLDRVIRHLVVRVDEELRVAERTRDARKATQARRRTARGLPPEPQPGEGRGDNMDQDDDRPRGGFFRRRRVCKFCAEKIDYINYKDVRLLTPFLPERGKIQPRRISGTCALHQRKLQVAIKRARQLALIPYVTE